MIQSIIIAILCCVIAVLALYVKFYKTLYKESKKDVDLFYSTLNENNYTIQRRCPVCGRYVNKYTGEHACKAGKK